MLREIHLDNKKTYHILAISGVILLIIAFFYEPKCIFKMMFNIPCVSCGLTRAFFSIISLDFIGAFNYNILSIPLFVSIIVFYILYIFNRKYLDKYFNYIVKNYKFIIIILGISWIINIVKYT